MSSGDATQIHRRYAHLAGEDAFRGAFTSISVVAEERSIPVIVMAMESHGDPWDVAMDEGSRHGFQMMVYGPRFSEHLVEIGRNTREGWIETFWLSPDDPHPNALGHQLIADVLVEALEETISTVSFNVYPPGQGEKVRG
jgi:hypothetical protein